MSLIHINHNPSRRQLNLFGGIWLVFFAVVGGLVLKGSGPMWAVVCIWVLAITVPMVGWISSPVMRVVYVGMAYLTLPIGLVVSFLIMAIVYYILITPIGVLMRWFGYDPMHRRLERGTKSYWYERTEHDELKRYFRQF